VLFFSDALKGYRKDNDEAYVEALKRLIHGSINQDELHVDIVQDNIQDLVDTCVDESWFHHVLTELAILEQRTEEEKANKKVRSVIPVLHNENKIRDLPWLAKTRVYEGYRGPAMTSNIPETSIHNVFISLLGKIYETPITIVRVFLDLYKTSLQSLQTEEIKKLPFVTFHMTLHSDIFLHLQRVRRGEAHNVKSLSTTL
jgi:hypothetical protein